MEYEVPTSRGLQGEFTVPGDKSISHRAAIIAALATGTSLLRGFPSAADPQSTVRCLRSLGVQIRTESANLIVHGKGLYGFRASPGSLDTGNSGTTMRLLAGILAGQPFESVLVGDESLSARPMNRVIRPLRQMGARIQGSPRGTAPLHIHPTDGLRPIDYTMPVSSAQVKSAVLLAGLYASGRTVVRESVRTRDHTERMLGLTATEENGIRSVWIDGGSSPAPLECSIPGDPSAAAFLVGAAALTKGSDIHLRGVGLNPTRTAFVEVLRKIGADINEEVESSAGGEPQGSVRVRNSELHGRLELSGAHVAGLIDEIPLVAVVAAVAGCPFRLSDASELRTKECDRITALVKNLRHMGMEVEERPDGFAFEAKNRVLGTRIETYHDHRIAMAFGIAGLVVTGIVIDDPECVSVSFPGFWEAIGRNS